MFGNLLKSPAPSDPSVSPAFNESTKVPQSVNPEVIQILDSATRLTLITFLALFAIFGLYNFYRFNTRRLTGSRWPDEKYYQKSWNILRPLLSSLTFSGLIAALSFFFFAFVPAPFLNNYATAESWQRATLRITSLQFDRFPEGFSLKGEIWNQQEGLLEELQVVVSVLDHNKESLARLLTTPVPSTLKSGQTATFEIKYTENSNLIYGYQLSFQDSAAFPISHVAGFDVE